MTINPSEIPWLKRLQNRNRKGISFDVYVGLAILCALLVAPFSITYVKEQTVNYLEVRMSSSKAGQAKVFFNQGQGLADLAPTVRKVGGDEILRPHRFILPLGTIQSIRLQPIDTAAQILMAKAQLVTKSGIVIKTFPLDEIVAETNAENIRRSAESLVINVSANSPPPTLLLKLSPAITFRVSSIKLILGIAFRFTGTFLGAIMLLAIVRFVAALHPLANLRHFARNASTYLQSRPYSALAIMALFAVVVNCYPVVFLNGSFVSPNLGTVLLYERYPTLPGYTSSALEENHGSDVGAMMWQNLPYSTVQHRAFFCDGELPLWNRYNSAGVMLLGQGLSMLGDPLHLLVIAANGASWAWDLKFLLGKWIFSLVIGSLVWDYTRHLKSALLAAFSAPFMGAFIYWLNHPAFFAVCYAPLILYSWARLTSATTMRSAVGWCGALLFSCVIVMNSGTVKEACMMVIAMNLVGVTVLLLSEHRLREKLIKLALSIWTGVIFGMVSSPFIMTLLSTMSQGYNEYLTNQSVAQLHPSLLLGLFDEFFYRIVTPDRTVLCPSANFLVLGGVAYALSTLNKTGAFRFKLALVLNILLLIFVVYSIIPDRWLIRVPFLAGVQHIHSCFSIALVVELAALAGLGYFAALTRLGTPAWLRDLACTAIVLMAIMFPYLAALNGSVKSLGMYPDRLLWAYLVILITSLIILFGLVRLYALRGRWSTTGKTLASICIALMLVRLGQHVPSNYFKEYIFHPPPRVDFHAKSPSIVAIQADIREPFRVIGIEAKLFPGWTSVYRLEGLSGADGFQLPKIREVFEACGLAREWGWRIVANYDAVTPDMKHGLDFAGVKYYVDQPREYNPLSKNLRLVLKSDLDVYASDTTWPRAFFTNRLAQYSTIAQFGNWVQQGDGCPFAAIETSDAQLAPALPADLSDRIVVRAINYRMTSNTSSFEVTATEPGIAVLHESWLKDDFHATLNGQRTPYLRINHAFKGVYIPHAGTYKIVFSYWPHHFTLLLIASAIGISLAFATWVVFRHATVPFRVISFPSTANRPQRT
jgi:hypothetical protein